VLGAANKSGVCSACSSGYKPKDEPPAKKTAGQAKTANTLARHALAARSVGTVTAIAPPAFVPFSEAESEQPIEDVIRSRLEHHRERVKELLHHQAEAAKLERALAALLEVNLP
jgi:hypothetical protein